jgi:hypothetical protein
LNLQLSFFGFKVLGFHPNRGRDRYRDRDRLFHHRTLSLVSGFMVSRFQGFWFHGFKVSGFHRGRDRYRDRDRLFHHRTQPPHSLTAFEVAGFARISIRQPCDAGADGPESGAARWQGGFPANRRRSILLLLGLIL